MATSRPQLNFSEAQSRALLKRLEAEIAKRQAETRLTRYAPYAKQLAFHAAGLTHRERLLMAANQVGKTIAGGAEVAFHVTGQYPDWWPGRRFNRPTKWWCASVTSDATRDNVQAKLIGPPESEALAGTGFVPKTALLDTTKAQGTPNLLDSALVRHISGGTSTIGFKSYSQGREKWQGPTLDGVWFDEEPPMDLYMEGLTRTNAVPDSLIMLTFTPLLGASDVVNMFLENA